MAKLKTELSGSGSNIRNEREYARSIGVPSPTVLTKAQLDEAVRRRELELGITKEKHNLYDFSPEERKSLYTQFSPKNRTQMFAGFFRSFPEGDGVLRRDPFTAIPETDVYVASRFVDECGLLEGDRIVGSIGVVPYNNIRVLRNVRYINDETTSRAAVRASFDTLSDVRPSEGLRISGNNAMIGIVRDIVCLGRGQSLSVSGICESNRAYLERAAAEILKGLYMSFDGNVFGIFENISDECRRVLTPVLNPESMIVDGDRAEYEYLLSVMKRSVERKIHAIVVIYAPDYDASLFIRAAKTTANASLTALIFSDRSAGAQAKIVMDGENVVVSELVNPLSGYVCGEKHRKIFRVLGLMENARPDDVLSTFTEFMHHA